MKYDTFNTFTTLVPMALCIFPFSLYIYGTCSLISLENNFLSKEFQTLVILIKCFLIVLSLQWYVQATCATQGTGLYEGLDWLSNELSKR